MSNESIEPTAEQIAELAEHLEKFTEQVAEQIKEIADKFAGMNLDTRTQKIIGSDSRLDEFLKELEHVTAAKKFPHDIYLRPERVAEYFPDLNADLLKTLRKQDTGPSYYKPQNSRRVYYKLSELVEWVEANHIIPETNLRVQLTPRKAKL